MVKTGARYPLSRIHLDAILHLGSQAAAEGEQSTSMERVEVEVEVEVEVGSRPVVPGTFPAPTSPLPVRPRPPHTWCPPPPQLPGRLWAVASRLVPLHSPRPRP